MENSSLGHIKERIPELKNWYIGSYPEDCIPSLPTFSFAIINTSSSSEAGEFWLMTARLNQKF